MNTNILKDNIKNKKFDEKIMHMYACKKEDTDKYYARFSEVIEGLEENFGAKDDIRLFSAPGRTEIGGNHTDHQHGCVLAASLNLDVIGAVAFYIYPSIIPVENVIMAIIIGAVSGGSATCANQVYKQMKKGGE